MGDKDATQSRNKCSKVPSIVSTFVDAFVDYVVGGQFIHSQPGKARVVQYSDTPYVLPAAKRLIAIGDMHGDLTTAKEALRIAEVMDVNEKWIGGKTVVVQVGDLLDRGSGEIKIIYLLEKLKREAQRQGGDVHILLGNHEIMNVEGDFRFTTKGGADEFRLWAEWLKRGNILKQRCEGIERPFDYTWSIPSYWPQGCNERVAALRPGGPITSRFLSRYPVVLIVGSTVFVHGGLLPQDVSYGIEDLNKETQEWLEGQTEWMGPTELHGDNAPVWLRKYSYTVEKMCDCETLGKVLAAIDGAKRMVVGHTIQADEGINAVCSKQVVRVDVGMSKGCGGYPPQVLEIKDDKVMTVLSAEPSEPVEPVADAQEEWGQASHGSALLPPNTPVKVPEIAPILPPQAFQDCIVPPKSSRFTSTIEKISTRALSIKKAMFPKPPIPPSPVQPVLTGPPPPPPELRIRRKTL